MTIKIEEREHRGTAVLIISGRIALTARSQGRRLTTVLLLIELPRLEPVHSR